jgi:hypothetical protein
MKPIKRCMQVFGLVAVLGSTAAGIYYFLFRRSRKLQVELYFDDGSMLAMPGNAAEAAPFVKVAQDILASHPVEG